MPGTPQVTHRRLTTGTCPPPPACLGLHWKRETTEGTGTLFLWLSFVGPTFGPNQSTMAYLVLKNDHSASGMRRCSPSFVHPCLSQCAWDKRRSEEGWTVWRQRAIKATLYINGTITHTRYQAQETHSPQLLAHHTPGAFMMSTAHGCRVLPGVHHNATCVK